MSAIRFDGRVAIVTGAGRGIGAGHARVLAALGAAVVVNDIDDSAYEVAGEIEAAGGTALACIADLTADDGPEAIVNAAIGTFGGVQLILGNAGSFGPQHPLLEVEPATLREHLELDIVSSFRLVKAAWPHLQMAGHGRVVLTSSSAAFGSQTEVAYGISKGAMLGLVRTLAVNGHPDGIAVNGLLPFGFTRMTTSNTRLTQAELDTRERVLRLELVAAAAAAMLHESCPLNGELVVAGGGRVTHVFLAETHGHIDAELTPETVAAHWSDVLDQTGNVVVGDTWAQIAHFMAEVPGWPAGAVSGSPGWPVPD